MNKVILIGNLTRDPELSETSSGVSVCRFAIAVNRSYTSADGERKTDFFNVTAWRTLGENVSKYAKKGTKVCVTGSIEIRPYVDGQGNNRTAVDVTAQEVEFLTPRKATEENSYGDYYSSGSGTGHQSGSGSSDGTRPTLQNMDDDDDIPF